MHYYRHDENLYILNTKNWKVISYKLAMKRWIQANVNTETISIYTLIIRIRMRFDTISKMLVLFICCLQLCKCTNNHPSLYGTKAAYLQYTIIHS